MKKSSIYDILNGYTTERIELLTMDIKKLIKKVLNFSCIYFTVITALYILILQIANVSEGAAAVEAIRVLLYFIASVLLSIANVLYSIKKIHPVLRVVIHYVICVFAFYTCFLLPVGMRSSFMITGIAIFTVVYAVIMGLIALFKSRLKKNRELSAEYQSQFAKK